MSSPGTGQWPGHLQRLCQVFTRLHQTQLKLNPDKCTLLCTSVTLLGHVASAQGIRLDPRLLVAIRVIAPPTDIKDVRSYLGLRSYYHRFVPDFSKKAAPLNQLLQKGQPWAWMEESQAVFEELKAQLLSPPITAFSNFSMPFHLYIDTSAVELGAILAQVHYGREQVVCCSSWTMTGAKRHYEAMKVECLAIIWALWTFQHYLIGAPL